MLTGWDIDILTEQEESDRRQEEFRSRSALFIEALDVDDVIAHLLVAEGFTSVEEVAFIDVQDLAAIEAFDEDVAAELQERAKAWLAEQAARQDARRKEMGVVDEVAAIEGLTPAMLVKLGEKNVKSLDDLADLAGDELLEIIGKDALSEDEANAVIMAARAHWFADGADQPGQHA
jgi:N utilization substance protein A